MAVPVVELDVEFEEGREHSRLAVANTPFEVVNVCFSMKQVLLRDVGKLNLLDTLILHHRLHTGRAESISHHRHPIVTQFQRLFFSLFLLVFAFLSLR